MSNLLINTLLSLISTIVQIICIPINALIINVFPSITNWLTSVDTVLSSIFNSITWALGIIPTPIINVLILIVIVEIAKHTVFISTHILLRLWNIFQKVKFW